MSPPRASANTAWVLTSCPWAILTLLLAACGNAPRESIDCSRSPGKLFEQRIEPLFTADHPNTCSQCHAGGIDLEQYMRPSACESMACLVQAHLVDLENPEHSILLEFIRRAEPESELITQQVIDEEHEAFLSWIEHEATCQRCQAVSCRDLDPPECDDLRGVSGFDAESDPGGCDTETLEKLFRGTVYQWRNRCTPCHFEEETTATSLAPRWLSRSGPCQVASRVSYQNLIESSYIDLEDPLKSLLLLKPLAEIHGGVYHEGHDKILEGETAYEGYVHFLQRYVACQE